MINFRNHTPFKFENISSKYNKNELEDNLFSDDEIRVEEIFEGDEVEQVNSSEDESTDIENKNASTDVKVDNVAKEAMTQEQLLDGILNAFKATKLTLGEAALAAGAFLITHRICWELVNRIALPIILVGLQTASCYVPVAIVATLITLNQLPWVLKTGLWAGNSYASSKTKEKYPNLTHYVFSPANTMINYICFPHSVPRNKIIELSLSAACLVSPEVEKIYTKVSNLYSDYFKSNYESLKKEIVTLTT